MRVDRGEDCDLGLGVEALPIGPFHQSADGLPCLIGVVRGDRHGLGEGGFGSGDPVSDLEDHGGGSFRLEWLLLIL